MIRIVPSIVAALLVAGCAARQPKPIPQEVRERLAVICSTTPCRTFKEGLPAVPYVYDDLVQIYLGESFSFTGVVREDRLVDLRFVQPDEPGPKIHVRFTEAEGQVVMSLQSSFEHILKYRAGMVMPDRPPQRTSACPIVANGAAYEMWPHPIDVLLLDQFRILKPTDPMVCD